ncbi:glycoside hydrolase family 76 protein [Coprobacter tertius]|uniref:Alpha-1,6-mannanase n=1 Tax=Coprobacter tertius TaxID=2944915 RepID=A0ABT1MFT4_9BACT|nr:glycoside hydrolase family 76 protein [Coprobacter tertius]MCP9611206.1 alpha-1,6-mannanase [Coprobacter tertius]
MKKYFILPLSLFILFLSCSCTEDNNAPVTDNISDKIQPVSSLSAVPTEKENQLCISWKNPNDNDLLKVEISYSTNVKNTTKASPNPILVNAEKGSESLIYIDLPYYSTYTVSAIAINKAGLKSAAVTTTATPLKPEDPDHPTPVFLQRADILMSSLIKRYLLGPRDVWKGKWPNPTGYWDGDAVVWGQGGGFSGYVALREASLGIEEYESKYTGTFDDRMLKSINQFLIRDTRNNVLGYSVYPASGNDRFFDDNVWIGLDMADLYMQTKKTGYLNYAKIVWKLLQTGRDNTLGGDGIYWQELPQKSNTKNTCSTAPAAVLATKLYLATGEGEYLEDAKKLYAWVKKMLQDPADYLYWDNIGPGENDQYSISKAKYTYNSGQPMQAACLLYKITRDPQYLTDAQNIARSFYSRWFTPFTSYATSESFRIPNPGEHMWFMAIAFRGFVELYKIDGDRTYIDNFEKTMTHAWLSDCRNSNTNLLNYNDLRGGITMTEWEIIHEGACVEILARLASLERDGL